MDKAYAGKKIEHAVAFVSGLGHYQLFVNGQHINAGRFLDPGPASYSKRVYYNGFDVSDALLSKGGKVAVGLMVGNGWYNPLPFKFWGHIALRENMRIGPPSTILRLVLTARALPGAAAATAGGACSGCGLGSELESGETVRACRC